MSQKLLITINNSHVEKWLGLKKAKSGKTVQDVIRDLLYSQMMSEASTDKNLENKIWGKQ